MTQTTNYCSECTGDLADPQISAMHMTSVERGLVCGVAGRLGRVVQGVAPDPSRTDSERVAAAREALAVLVTALENHESMEDTPVEVRAKTGWEDVIDLTVKIGEALA